MAFLGEPAFIEEGENGLLALTQFPQVKEARDRIRSIWADHLQDKLKAVLAFCEKQKVNVVVFPEYSIPIELLAWCREFADTSGVTIVAGSHTVTGGELAGAAYARSGLGSLNLAPLDPSSDIRKSICPIFIPRKPSVAVAKMSKSVWETDMALGSPSLLLELPAAYGPLKSIVLLCIDALRAEHLGTVFHKQTPELLIIPSLSQKTTPFEIIGQLSLMNECPCIYVNSALWGGSRIFAKSGVASTSWPAESDGCEALPLGSEAIIVADIDFDEQFQVRTTVRPHFGMKIVSYAPLLYLGSSQLVEDFVRARDECLQRGAFGFSQQIRETFQMLTMAKNPALPVLLQNKLGRMLRTEENGSLRLEDAIFFMETVDLPTSVCSPLGLRAVLAQNATALVAALFPLPETLPHQELLIKVMRQIGKYRQPLPSPLSAACTGLTINPPEPKLPSPQEASPEPASQIFFDRYNELNQIRQFVNDRERKLLFLAGMRGMGKTALLQRAFVEIMPKWRRVWITATEGMPFEQVIATLANNLDIPTTTIPDRENARVLARTVLARIESLELVGLVFDDSQNFLGINNDFRDPELQAFLKDIVDKPTRRSFKVFLIANVSLPFPRPGTPGATYLALRGLHPTDSRNLLDYWLRLQAEEMKGDVFDIPENLINFLQGHPLALKIAARLCITYGVDPLTKDLRVFKKLREAIVEVLMDKVYLTEAQKALMEFASIFRIPAYIDVFRKWGGEIALIELQSIAGRFLLDTSPTNVQMHPAVAQYFYEQASQTAPRKVRALHEVAADYYLRAYKRSKPQDVGLLVEAAYHVGASGNIDKARALGIHKDELRALGKRSYELKQWETALDFYTVASNIGYTDAESQARIALCLGRLARWQEADEHFKKAVELKGPSWIFQAYGAVKMNGGLTGEAEQLLGRALEINDRDSAALATLAMLRLMQRQDDQAEKLFQEALEANPENPYALFNYAKFLFQANRVIDAKPYAELAAEVDPRNKQVRDLLRKVLERTETPE